MRVELVVIEVHVDSWVVIINDAYGRSHSLRCALTFRSGVIIQVSFAFSQCMKLVLTLETSAFILWHFDVRLSSKLLKAGI
jgi:hypothetical protein